MAENQQETELSHFRRYRSELDEKVRSGKLRYIVEWWEEDCLDIDENVHVFFQFEGDGEHKWEFEAFRPIRDELKAMLAGMGITWEYPFEQHFGSRILSPTEWAGQAYYEKIPPSPKKWWEHLFTYLTGNDGVRWIRRKDLPLP